MIQLDTTAAVGVVGALAVSAAVAATVRGRRKRMARTVTRQEPQDWLKDLPMDLHLVPVEVVPAMRVESTPKPLMLQDPQPAAPLVLPFAAAEAGEGPRSTVKVRKVAPAGKARTPRPMATIAAADAAPGVILAEQKAELLSLIETMQWDRALAAVQTMLDRGAELSAFAAEAEAAALERVRALPESEAKLATAGYAVLAALAPSNETYAERIAQAKGALEGRRATLLDRLTRDEDRFEPGTTWFNHPYNPAFDDIRLPIWLYIGCKEDGHPWLRLRTNWLGDTRISVQGIDAIYDGITEYLTDGHYKIDADALGWEWRDEAASAYQIEVLRSIASAEHVTLKYKGDPYAIEVEMSAEEKAAVADMLELFDLMRQSAPAQALQAVAA
jgi:hypothetical protein